MLSRKGKKHYMNLDEFDSRIPLYCDEDFQRGIEFNAKVSTKNESWNILQYYHFESNVSSNYVNSIDIHLPSLLFWSSCMQYVGCCEVPRPNSRVEIVAAMRRIRVEFKEKSIAKRSVTVHISTNGVKVILHDRTAVRNLRKFERAANRETGGAASGDVSHLRSASSLSGAGAPLSPLSSGGSGGAGSLSPTYALASQLVLFQHPTYRIFYVSHDSLDMKIFSYIARDSHIFKCYVFKTQKKVSCCLSMYLINIMDRAV